MYQIPLHYLRSTQHGDIKAEVFTNGGVEVTDWA